MGILHRIENIVNNAAPDYSNIHLSPRSVPLYIDNFLKGKARFCKKIGGSVAVLDPDIEMNITKEIYKTNVIPIDIPSPWLALNSIVSLGPNFEYAILTDYDTTNLTLTLDRDITAYYTSDNTVQLYAVPINLHQNYAKGTSTFVVDTYYKMVNGDEIGYYAQEGLLESLIKANVIIARYLTEYNTPQGVKYLYEIQIDIPLKRNLTSTSEFFLMAYPSYISDLLNYPESFIGSNFIGPFAIDYLSGCMKECDEIAETWSIIGINKQGAVEQTSPLTVSKNTIITNVSVPPDVLLFWNIMYGSMQFTPGFSVGVCDTAGYWAINYECIPVLNAGTEWIISVKSTNNATLNIGFLPNEYRTFDLLSNTITFITIGTTSSELPIERIEFAVKSAPGTQIMFGDWQPTKPISAAVYTHLVAKVRSNALWRATGLIVKPIFFNLDLLRGRYDTGQKYNSGLIYL